MAELHTVQTALAEKSERASVGGSQTQKFKNQAKQAGIICGLLRSNVMSLSAFQDTRHLLDMTDSPVDELVREYCKALELDCSALIN